MWFQVTWIRNLKPLRKTLGHMVSPVRAAHHMQTLPETRKRGNLPNSLCKANITLTSSSDKEIKRKRGLVSLTNTDMNISKQKISKLNLVTHKRGQWVAALGDYCSNVRGVKRVWTPPMVLTIATERRRRIMSPVQARYVHGTPSIFPG